MGRPESDRRPGTSRSQPEDDTSDTEFEDENQTDEESFLKSLIYYRQLSKFMIRSFPITSKKKGYVLTEKILDSCFTNLTEKIGQFPTLKSFSSLFSKKNLQKKESWTEFRDMVHFFSTPYNDASKKDPGRSTTGINTAKRKKLGINKKNLSNKQKRKELASASLARRPRRSCTRKRPVPTEPASLSSSSSSSSDESYSPPPIKKSNLETNTKSNKIVENVVVRCDPFPVLPTASSSVSIPINSHQVSSSGGSNQIPAPIQPMILLGNRPLMNLIPPPIHGLRTINTNPIRFGISRPVLNNPQIPGPFPNRCLNAPKQPYMGKVLLINNVPCLVQNGSKLQLPMIRTPIPAPGQSPVRPPTTVASDPKPIERTNKDAPKTIKIEDDSDEEDNKARVQEEIKKQLPPDKPKTQTPVVSLAS